jgi:hypothetical protein
MFVASPRLARVHDGGFAQADNLLLRGQVDGAGVLLQRWSERGQACIMASAGEQRYSRALLDDVSSSFFSELLSSFSFSMAARCRRMTVCASSQ